MLGKFLSSRAGRYFYNICYNWGACLIILGAVMKIMHAPYDNVFLMVGLVSEVFIFFISGFDEPDRVYKWERAFPALNNKNANTDSSTMTRTGVMKQSGSIARLNKNVEALNEAYINKLNELCEEQIKQMKNGNNNNQLSESTEKLAESIASLNEKYKKMLNSMN